MAWPAYLVAVRLAAGRGRPARVAVGAVALASWDLFLDPQMVDAGHWRWVDPAPALPGVPTVPLTNYAGWLLVALVLMAVLDAVAPAEPSTTRHGAVRAVPVDVRVVGAGARGVLRPAGVGALGRRSGWGWSPYPLALSLARPRDPVTGRRRGPAGVVAGRASALAGGAAPAHAVVNAALLRRPDPTAGCRTASGSRCCCRCATRRARVEACLRVAARPGRRRRGPRARRRLDRRHRRGGPPGGRRRSAGRRPGRQAAAGRLARQAARLPAARRRGRPGERRAASSSTPTWCSAPPPSPPPSTCSGGTGSTCVCPYPRQLAVTPAERLVQPLLQWSWLTFLPLRAGRALAPAVAVGRQRAAAGGAPGGVRAGRRARAPSAPRCWRTSRCCARSSGPAAAAAVADGTALATCRMYGGWAELRDGYTKSLWAAFGSPAGAAAVVGVLGLAYVLPAAGRARAARPLDWPDTLPAWPVGWSPRGAPAGGPGRTRSHTPPRWRRSAR